MSTFPGAFVPVAPPADGLRLAFVAARRRRNTKAGAAGAAGLLSLLLVLAGTGGAGNRTLLQEPLPPSHTGLRGITGVAPSAQPSPPALSVDQPVALAAARRPGSIGAPHVTSRVVAPAPSLDRTTRQGGVTETRVRPASGPMNRSYGWNAGGGDLTCPARKQQQGQRSLCTDVTAYSSGGLLSITAEICNFDARAQTLDYPTARELDVSVHRGGAEIWRWSTGRHFENTPHELALPVGDCMMWTTEWSQRDSRGNAVPAGSYDVVADFDAEQLPAADRHPSYSATVS